MPPIALANDSNKKKDKQKAVATIINMRTYEQWRDIGTLENQAEYVLHRSLAPYVLRWLCAGNPMERISVQAHVSKAVKNCFFSSIINSLRCRENPILPTFRRLLLKRPRRLFGVGVFCVIIIFSSRPNSSISRASNSSARFCRFSSFCRCCNCFCFSSSSLQRNSCGCG